MLAGDLYSPADPALQAAHLQARRLCRLFNAATEEETTLQQDLLRQLLGSLGARVEIKAPFLCDYGKHIHVGEGVFINFGCVILDCGRVTIGAHSLLGPGVHLYAADHPRLARERATGRESGRPISIGRHVWIGGRVVVCPGVSIGDNTTLGAGSVVTHDIPANVVAAGNPCRVIRPLEPWEAPA